jgi:hypothetical protein
MNTSECDKGTSGQLLPLIQINTGQASPLTVGKYLVARRIRLVAAPRARYSGPTNNCPTNYGPAHNRPPGGSSSNAGNTDGREGATYPCLRFLDAYRQSAICRWHDG